MAERLAYIVLVDAATRRPHSNADRLDCVTVYGNNVIISKTMDISTPLVYFPTDMQLGEEFCQINDLIRRKDENGNAAGGYLEQNRYLRPLKLRGEVSDGLLLPLTCLAAFTDVSKLTVGMSFNHFGNITICQKYTPYVNPSKAISHAKGKKVKVNKDLIEAQFPQHIDTEQLAYNVAKFKAGDKIVITEKLDGTSHRSALLSVKKTNWFKRFFRIKPKTVYKDYCGSRRVTIKSAVGGFYGDNNFRINVHKTIVPFLEKNMEVFGEIVGYVNGAPIMPSCNTKCLNDKAFTRKYGENMEFSYGCDRTQYDFYVYRIANVDEDGDVIYEWSTREIKTWCDDHGFKCVPILAEFVYDPEVMDILSIANKYNGGASTVDPSHIREGCVFRIENDNKKFEVFKSKNNEYRIMRGMKVDTDGTNGALDADAAEEMS